MQKNIGGATFYITYLQLGYILHSDALKFDFKLTNTNKLISQQIIFMTIFNGYWLNIAMRSEKF